MVTCCSVDQVGRCRDNMSQTGCSLSVPDFYRGKSVFITGGTGFLGKVLIEKLLYSCSDIDKVYVLVRNTSKYNQAQKMERLLHSQAFARLKAKKPEDLAKIILVAGDMMEPNLGLNHKDEETLMEKVSIVFHLAATIKFDEPLKEALLMNVEGTRKLLELSRRMKRLQAFVHVSTAFVNVNRSVAEELVYKPPLSLEEVYKCLEQHGQDEKKMKKLLAGHPNTYTFTKALAETLIVETRGNIPVAILRPSIVMPSEIEPVEGWVDSWQGALGLFTACAKGWMRVLPGNHGGIADLIPLDYVTNMTIVAASRCTGSSDVAVYHCCTSGVNPITWRAAAKFFIDEGIKNGFNELPFPAVIMLPRSCMIDLVTFLTQTVPAHLMDLTLVIRRKQRRYVRHHSKMIVLRNVLERFMTDSWEFRSERAQALASDLSPTDRRSFPCHPADIQWKPYMATCNRGVERFLLKSKPKCDEVVVL